MTSIKQFNRIRAMVKGRKQSYVSIENLKKGRVHKPIKKTGQRRSKGMMKVR